MFGGNYVVALNVREMELQSVEYLCVYSLFLSFICIYFIERAAFFLMLDGDCFGEE